MHPCVSQVSMRWGAPADDAPEGRQGCIAALCAYLRQPYHPPRVVTSTGATPQDQASTAIESAQTSRDPGQERQVRLTVIRLIRDNLHLPDDDPGTWRGHDFNFAEALFDGGDFTGQPSTAPVPSPSPAPPSPTGCHSREQRSPEASSRSTVPASPGAASVSAARNSPGASLAYRRLMRYSRPRRQIYGR